jgi:pimeloyl-[acyl-carrier protein] synthase
MVKTHVNVLSPEFINNPYPFFAEIRQDNPIFFDSNLNMWLVTGYHETVTLLKERRMSSAFHSQPLEGNEIPWIKRSEAQVMMFMDPPHHTRIRDLLHKSFTPSVLAQLQMTIRRITHELLERMETLEQVDFIHDFTYPLPVRVITEMLGVPLSESDLLRDWARAVVEGTDVAATPEIQRQGDRAIEEFSEYLLKVIAQRRQHPEDDLLTMLVQAEDQGNVLSEDELVFNSLLLLNAGHETTTHFLANGLLALMQNPDQMLKLKQDLSIVPTTVEEMLRYDGSVGIVTRVVTEDFEIGGQQLKAGQRILAFPGAANRDPRVFSEPDRFDITRTPNPHLAFGYGIHYCLGASLARMESIIALEAFLKRYPSVQLAPQTLEYATNLRIRSLKHLYITL